MPHIYCPCCRNIHNTVSPPTSLLLDNNSLTDNDVVAEILHLLVLYLLFSMVALILLVSVRTAQMILCLTAHYNLNNSILYKSSTFDAISG